MTAGGAGVRTGGSIVNTGAPVELKMFSTKFPPLILMKFVVPEAGRAVPVIVMLG